MCVSDIAAAAGTMASGGCDHPPSPVSVLKATFASILAGTAGGMFNSATAFLGAGLGDMLCISLPASMAWLMAMAWLQNGRYIARGRSADRDLDDLERDILARHEQHVRLISRNRGDVEFGAL